MLYNNNYNQLWLLISLIILVIILVLLFVLWFILFEIIILFMIWILVYNNYRRINKETQYEKYVIDNLDEKQHPRPQLVVYPPQPNYQQPSQQYTQYPQLQDAYQQPTPPQQDEYQPPQWKQFFLQLFT